MSAVEETKTEISVQPSAPVRVSPSFLTRGLDFLSSVRFGVTLLVLLVILSMIGMLVVQQDLQEFQKYYNELTPSQRLLYGSLGFFDIYHSWYFNLLLLVLSVNIVLASIDRFPKAWTFIKRKKLDASRNYLKNQPENAALTLTGESREEVAARIAEAGRRTGYKATVTEKGGRTFVFLERGAWNRLGAYAVHVALLTIFLGGFLTAQFARTGNMEMIPGQPTDRMVMLQANLDQLTTVPLRVPFTIICEDIQQILVRKDGSIRASNTIDWLTRIRIRDERGEHTALVHLNTPYDYRGYRFFQASFSQLGNARHITLTVTPQAGGEPQTVTIPRNGSATLADGTRLDYANFFPDFRMNGSTPDTASTEYDNPAAQLNVMTPGGQQLRAFAFAAEVPANVPVGAPVGGYRYRLTDFERVSFAHVLSVKYDPYRGALIFYIGGTLLILTLCAVFFFSHERVWALIEEPAAGHRYEAQLGGNTNRNQMGFADRFKKLVAAIQPASSREANRS